MERSYASAAAGLTTPDAAPAEQKKNIPSRKYHLPRSSRFDVLVDPTRAGITPAEQ